MATSDRTGSLWLTLLLGGLILLGAGLVMWAPVSQCPLCDGSKLALPPGTTFDARFFGVENATTITVKPTPCPKCEGTGRVPYPERFKYLRKIESLERLHR